MTKKIVDLHVHSNKSDGTFTPSELVDYAVEKGLTAFALTDHDTIEGVNEALLASEGKPVTVLPGVEFSTEYEGKDIHIVGLMIDPNCPAILEKMQEFVSSRILRNQKMCAALQASGIDVSYEKLMETYPGAVITRAHYAKYMIKEGYVKSFAEAFERYIGDRAPCFIPREKVTPQDAIKLILEAKGIPVLAHPLLYGMGKDRLQLLVERLKEAGLVAIEAVYSTYSPSEEAEMRKLAKDNGLLISGGSDFHGSTKPGLDLAVGYGRLYIPEEILINLKEKKDALFS